MKIEVRGKNALSSVIAVGFLFVPSEEWANKSIQISN